MIEKTKVPGKIKDYLLNSLLEAKEGKNLHMDHIDDLPLLYGYEGAQYGLDLLSAIYTQLVNGTLKTVNTKLDGAPAVFFGKDPETGEYILALKALFGKNPKIIRTEEDIDKFYGAKEDLALKLKYVWEAFTSTEDLTNGEIWQGDLMFTPDSIKEMKIKGESYFVFHPNTILYAVKESSSIGKVIEKADVGVAWHTRYKGNSIADLQSSHDLSKKEFNQTPLIWQLDTNTEINPPKGIKSPNFLKYKSQAEINIQKLSAIAEGYDQIKDAPNFIMEVNTFINSNIREGNISFNPQTFVDDFKNFVVNKFETRIDSYKSKGKRDSEIKAVERARDKVLSVIEDESLKLREYMPLIITLQQILNNMKLEIIKLINESFPDDILTFLVNKQGKLIPTEAEGFVLTDPQTGKTGKAVDRLNFSKANFSDEWVKGWQKT